MKQSWLSAKGRRVRLCLQSLGHGYEVYLQSQRHKVRARDRVQRWIEHASRSRPRQRADTADDKARPLKFLAWLISGPFPGY